MKEKIPSHLMIFIPKFNLMPFEKVQEWADRYYRQRRHTSGHRRKAIRTYADFKQKIAQPTIEITKQFINPDFRSRSGLTAQHIIDKLKDKILDNAAARKYKKNLDR